MVKIKKTEEGWRKELSEDQYRILRKKGTEPAFSGKLLKNNQDGFYHCAACGARLFSSETKFDSGTGWPSFYDAHSGNIQLKKDVGYGMTRTEVVCKMCGSHLGHLFEDSPNTPTGKRFCINSCSLEFKKTKGG